MKQSQLKVRCVIYDCDGVLFDSLEANTRLYNDLCMGVDRSPLREAEMRYVHSHTVLESIRFLFRDDPVSEERALELLKEVDFRKYIVYLKMEPHLLEILDVLKGRGIYRAISTNRTTSMPHIMEAFNLGPYFDMVVTALDVENPKPHPESIEKIVQHFSLHGDEVAFVGDSEVDKQAAISSKVTFIAYKNREIADNFFIGDHLGLLNLIC